MVHNDYKKEIISPNNFKGRERLIGKDFPFNGSRCPYCNNKIRKISEKSFYCKQCNFILKEIEHNS